MRRTAALIVGGGPAGAAAAILLARAGRTPLLIERTTGPHDIVCGGFLGWDALAALARLGVDPAALGARPIDRVRFVAGARSVEARLPKLAAGLSRRTLDEALLKAAAEAGADVQRGRTAKAVNRRLVRLDDGEEIEAESLFLATGKHELRGAARTDAEIDAAPLGLRTAVPASASLEGVIELHLFDGGYAGLLVQEDGMANLCMSVSRARLKRAGGIEALVAELAREQPRLGARMGAVPPAEWTAVAGIPYGWRARTTEPGIFRVGDQAAVIASLAGDGIAIALASGMDAAAALLRGESAEAYQAGFAKRARRPLAVGEMLRRAAEHEATRRNFMTLLGAVPALIPLAARLTRIG